MKVKILTSSFGLKILEEKINMFICDKSVIDIKIQTSDKITLAMIIYRED